MQIFHSLRRYLSIIIDIFAGNIAEFQMNSPIHSIEVSSN